MGGRAATRGSLKFGPPTSAGGGRPDQPERKNKPGRTNAHAASHRPFPPVQRRRTQSYAATRAAQSRAREGDGQWRVPPRHCHRGCCRHAAGAMAPLPRSDGAGRDTTSRLQCVHALDTGVRVVETLRRFPLDYGRLLIPLPFVPADTVSDKASPLVNTKDLRQMLSSQFFFGTARVQLCVHSRGN